MPRPRLRVESLEDRSVPAAIGALDASYGTAGVSILNLPNAQAINFLDAAPVADGKVVVVGTLFVTGGANEDFLVVRLNPDGSLDTTFNNGAGFRSVDFGGNDEARAVTIQPDGKILVVGPGRGLPRDFCVIRLNPDGTFDDTFDTDGQLTRGLGGEDVATGVVVQSDGEIVVTGYTDTNGTEDFAAVLLGPTGDLVNQNVIDINGNGRADQAVAAVVYGDGADLDRVLLVGSTTAADGSLALAVLKLTPGLGLVADEVVDAGAGEVASDAALLPDGRVLVVGRAFGPSSTDYLAVRFAAGTISTLDTSFNPTGTRSGTPGIGLYDLGSLDAANHVIVQPDGKALLIGQGGAGGAVLRLTTDGVQDPVFRGGVSQDSGANSYFAAALQPDGKVVAFGNQRNSSGNSAARFTGNIGLPGELAVSGVGTGAVPVFVPGGGGLDTTPIARPTPIAGVAVNSVLADVNGDGTPDLVVGQTAGGDRVVVLDGRDETGGTVLASFSAFGGFGGGVFVAGGDLTGDGRAEVIVSPVLGGLGPRVAVFAGASMTGATGSPTKLADFNGIADAVTGAADNSPGTIQLVGARVAVADATGDGIADLAVAAGSNGGPRITIWDGKNVAAASGGTPAAPPLANAFVFEDTQRDGAFVTLGDVTGDGLADLIAGGGPNGGPRIRIGDMAAILAAKNFGKFDDQLGVVKSNFLVGDPNSRGGIRVAARDLDGDNLADLVTGSGANLPSQVQVFRGTRLASLTSGVQTGDQVFDPFGAVLADGVYVG